MLDKAASQLITNGFSGSAASDIVNASLQVKQYAQSQKYLQNLSWGTNSKQESKTLAAGTLDAATVLSSLVADADSAFLRAMKTAKMFSAAPFTSDQRTSMLVERLLSEESVDYVSRMMRKSDADVQSLFTQTAQADGAAEFWSRIIGGLIADYGRTPSRLETHIGPLLKLYGETFKKPEYECATWIQLGRMRTGFIGIQADYLNRALSSAPNDRWRFEAMRGLVLAYVVVREFPSALQVIDGMSSRLSGADSLKRISDLRAQVIKFEQKSEAMANQVARGDAEKDKQNRIAFLEQQFEAAKSRGAAPDTLVSLQKSIDTLRGSQAPADSVTE